MDKEMTDGRTAWIRAFETRNMDMLDMLLKESDINTNFVNKEGMAAILATSYQSNDRGNFLININNIIINNDYGMCCLFTM